MRTPVKAKQADSRRRDKSTEEIADLLDLDRATVLRWTKSGLPHDKPRNSRDRRAGHRYDAAEVQTWMKTHHRTGAVGRPVDDEGLQLRGLKIRKETALVKRYEREEAIAAGKFIDAEAEQRRDVAKIAAVRNRLCGLGATISPQLEGLDGAQRQSLIDDAVEQILNDLAKT